MDRKAVERMLKASEKDTPGREAHLTDATSEFEEYTSEPRLDEQGRPIAAPKGLRAAGWTWPPPGPEPPLTKENLAKGVGVAKPAGASEKRPAKTPGAAPGGTPTGPSAPHAAPSPATARSQGGPPRASGTTTHAPSPPGVSTPPGRPAPSSQVKVDDDGMNEVYERPDLKANPRTGKGIRAPAPEPKRAGEILAEWREPDAQVVTPKRFQVFPPREPRASKDERERPEAHDEASLHAEMDLGQASNAIMSKPVANGPRVEVVDEDPLQPLRRPVTDAPQSNDPPAEAGQLHPAEAATTHAPATMPTTTPTPVATMPSLSEDPLPPARRSSAHSATEAEAPAATPTQTVANRPHVSDAPRLEPGSDVRIGLVQCDFNRAVTDAMTASARTEADRLGATVVQHVHVPGVFDAPLATHALMSQDDVDGVVVLGCVIQGETAHDQLITHATAKTLQDLVLRHGKPIGFGVTGPGMTEEQAWARVDAGAFAVASVVAQKRLMA